ncbi:MAG: hypothetical protein AB7O39_08695 [Flavobacteriaceae bacterium]
MQNILLHIGLPNTGAAYLRHWLALNRAAHARNGLGAPAKA